MAGIKKAIHLCDQCWCPKEQLGAYASPRHDARTAVQQEGYLAEVQRSLLAGGIGRAEATSGRLSTLGVPCGLWDFADRDAPDTDLHRCDSFGQGFASCLVYNHHPGPQGRTHTHTHTH